MTENRQELLEIYKLHAELADRVSQRREGAQRLHAALLTGILILLAPVLRYGAEMIPVWIILAAIGFLGMVLSISWVIIIRSCRQLNTGKFQALHELEQMLAYPFFKKEWEFLDHGRSRSRYWKLTIVETFLPSAFFVIFLSLIMIALFVYE